MDIRVKVQPVKLVYRPVIIEKLILFFYVEDLKPETRNKAEKLKQSLSQRLNSHVEQSMEMHELRKRKNKVKIEITCPVLEVPFSNNPQWIYEQSNFGEVNAQMSQLGQGSKVAVEEKWLIAMGDLLLTNYQAGSQPNTIKEQGDVTQAQTHKNFLLKIKNSYFKY